MTNRARADVAAAWDFLASVAGEEIADVWQDGLEKAIATFSQMPGRSPIAPKAEHLPVPLVRQFFYRWIKKDRVLLRLHEEPDEAPVVRIIGIRYGAQEALTPEEAKAWEQGE